LSFFVLFTTDCALFSVCQLTVDKMDFCEKRTQLDLFRRHTKFRKPKYGWKSAFRLETVFSNEKNFIDCNTRVSFPWNILQSNLTIQVSEIPFGPFISLKLLLPLSVINQKKNEAR
jgi:hypothetical protein